MVPMFNLVSKRRVVPSIIVISKATCEIDLAMQVLSEISSVRGVKLTYCIPDTHGTDLDGLWWIGVGVMNPSGSGLL